MQKARHFLPSHFRPFSSSRKYGRPSNALYVMESKSNLPLFLLTDLDSINVLWKDLFDVVMRSIVAEVAQKSAIVLVSNFQLNIKGEKPSVSDDS